MSLPTRTWIKTASSPSSSFRLLTWNLLADGLAQHGDFVKCPPEELEWSKRRPRILAEIARCQADIICLQELNHADAMLASLPEYRGLFLPKLPSPAEAFGAPPDGCALLYRMDRFTATRPMTAEYFHHGITAGRSKSGFICAHLEDKLSLRQVTVCVTHLKAKSGDECDSIRRAQMTQVLTSLESSEESGIVLAGDFNTEPQSEPLQLATRAGFESIWQFVASSVEFTTWKFRPVAAHEEATTPDGLLERRRIIDHVLVRNRLAFGGYWSMPSRADLGAGGVPSAMYPSDHLAVGVEIGWMV